jgi:hypothetical protein
MSKRAQWTIPAPVEAAYEAAQKATPKWLLPQGNEALGTKAMEKLLPFWWHILQRKLRRHRAWRVRLLATLCFWASQTAEERKTTTETYAEGSSPWEAALYWAARKGDVLERD